MSCLQLFRCVSCNEFFVLLLSNQRYCSAVILSIRTRQVTIVSNIPGENGGLRIPSDTVTCSPRGAPRVIKNMIRDNWGLCGLTKYPPRRYIYCMRSVLRPCCLLRL